ncbi:hypothetical protein MT418_000733 [Batrachochytrium dendrobatidis]
MNGVNSAESKQDVSSKKAGLASRAASKATLAQSRTSLKNATQKRNSSKANVASTTQLKHDSRTGSKALFTVQVEPSDATPQQQPQESSAKQSRAVSHVNIMGSSGGLLDMPSSINGKSRKQSSINIAVSSSLAQTLASNNSASVVSANSVYNSDTLIEGTMPLFLTGTTQDIFKIKIGENVNINTMFKVIPKSDLISDIQTRLAISDFYPAKQIINQFPHEELLVHYDPEFKYGQNFFICTTIEAMNAILNPIVNVDMPDNFEAQNIIETVREWKSLGSDKEIEMERVFNTRELVLVKVSRKQSEYKNLCKFGDRDAHDGFLECRPYRDANYDLTRAEMQVAVQAVPDLVSKHIQTTWFRSVNFACQYEPVVMENDHRERILQSVEMDNFLRNVAVRFEHALQQNSIVNIFENNYSCLGEEDMTLDQGIHTVLQEYQSFTDLVNSKDRCISCIDWHPQQKGVLAISCTQRMSYEEKIERGSSVKSKQSLIIIWSFHDPIHPQLILEAPEDVHAFRFNPVDPNIVVAGCTSGQIVLWDVSEYQDKLKSTRKAENDSIGISDEGKDKHVETPVVKYSVVSSIEASHRACVTDIHWLSTHFELSSNGEMVEHGEYGHKQIVTSSLDGTIAFWDLRYKKDWKSLDLAWRPFLRVSLSSLDSTFDYSLTRVSICTTVVDKPKSGDVSSHDTPPSAGKEKEKAASQKLWTSKFYCVTEEGDVIYSDWIAEKATEEKVSRVEFAFSSHFGPASDLQRSPFCPDILLSVGGWSFSLWKEKLTLGPILASAPASTYLISGCWSPTRPGVFYIGRADGVLEVWDLLDTSHAPSMIQTVTSTAISYMQIYQYGGRSGNGQQYLAVGDDAGTLHILEISKNLQRPSKNEKSVTVAFFEKEARRVLYTHGRKQIRIKERAGFESNALLTKNIAAAVQPKQESWNAPAAEPGTAVLDDEDEKAEKEYLKLEHDFLEAEGLLPSSFEEVS